MYADSRYNWSKIAGQWQDVMHQLKARHPDEQSRRMQKQEEAMFHYRVQ